MHARLFSVLPRSGVFLLTPFFLASVALAQQTPANAPQPWRWPDQAENLRVLPQTTTASELRETMLSFTRGLGVRCVYCHVGEEGKDFNEWDFASDDRRPKNIARAMLRMVRTINTEHLATIDTLPQDRVQVTCATCHRRVTRPFQLEDVLMATYQADGIDAALTEYQNLHMAYYGSGAYDFRPDILNRFAGQLQRTNVADAITAFRFSTEQNPDFIRTYSLLARAYVAASDTTQAIATLEHALAQSPQPPWSELLQQQLDALK